MQAAERVSREEIRLLPNDRRSSSFVWRALRSAASAVEMRADCAGLAARERAECVSILCHAIRQASQGDSPDVGRLSSNVPARQLLEAVRTQFIEQLATAPFPVPSVDTIHALKAFETVQAALDRDAGQRFAARLAGPEAIDLLVSVAHDMRSPLASILFLVESLRNAQARAGNPHQERQLGLVYSAAFGLSALSCDLIDLAHGGDRLLDTTTIPFSVTEVFYSVRDIVQPIAEEKQLSVELSLPEIELRSGHSAALTRVLLNLTTNALKFTDKGKVTVTAKELSRTRVEFSVCDTGKGIPPEVMETLFDAFRSRHESKQVVFSSAGLGLSLCQKLVAAMGGELQVRSVPGEGTCFFFQLEMPPVQRI